MSSSVPPRRIASNWLWTPEGFLRRPLVTLDDGGRILDVRTCDAPDREPFTEFYAGVLVAGFPSDWRGALSGCAPGASGPSPSCWRLSPGPMRAACGSSSRGSTTPPCA